MHSRTHQKIANQLLCTANRTSMNRCRQQHASSTRTAAPARPATDRKDAPKKPESALISVKIAKNNKNKDIYENFLRCIHSPADLARTNTLIGIPRTFSLSLLSIFFNTATAPVKRRLQPDENAEKHARRGFQA
ncbi:hypothetical protein ACSMFT_20850 [Ectopseudomonas oleovorans]|uniref:hypothetical protein n=1 Tax=Ectopseudomonas oleovorans TaxID=301 RepID=UPI003F1D6F61